MKSGYVWLPVALLVGLVLGGLGPRSEMEGVRKELESARLRLKTLEQKNRGQEVDRVAGILGIGADREQSDEDNVVAVKDDEPESRREDYVSGLEDDNTSETEPDKVGGGAESEGEPDRRSSSMEERIDRASELWEARADIARGTFIANGDLSEEDVKDFDVLMEAMNIRLEHSIAQWAEKVKGKGEADPEDGVRLINSVTDILVLTYDEMDRKLPDDWRETAGKGLRVADFIDPVVAKPLVRVEDEMGNMRGEFRGRNRSRDESSVRVD